MFLSRYHLQVQEADINDVSTIVIFSETAFKTLKHKKLQYVTLAEITEPICFDDLLKILSYLNYYFVFKQKRTPFNKYINLSTDEFDKIYIQDTFSHKTTHNSDKTTSLIFSTIPKLGNPRDAVDYFPHLFSL